MFTDKMTVLIAPSTKEVASGSRNAGVYVWEKENTLKVTRVTVKVHARKSGAKPLVWARKETIGMTVKAGKLRLWGKGSKGFFSTDDVHEFCDRGMDPLVQGFLARHGFAYVGDDAAEDLTWAYAPEACALFGPRLVQDVASKMEDGIPFSVVKKANINLFLDAVKVADRYRDVACEALQHQDYRNLRSIIIASSMGYAGEAHEFLDLPFSYTERPNQGLTVVAARTMVLPQEVMPLAIRGYDDRDTVWEIDGQPLEMVPFNPGDDPKTWIADVRTAYQAQRRLEREAQKVEHLEIMARQSLRDLEATKVHLSCLSQQEVESDLLKWQEDGLLDQDNRGLLVWKAVTKDRCGVLGYQYTIDEPFANGGMAAVGPWGAVKEYGHRGNYVLALRITEGGPVHAAQRPGVWYAIKGVPVAQYLITEMTEDGFVPVLVAGTDEMAILTGIPSKRGDIPQAPIVFANDDDYSF